MIAAKMNSIMTGPLRAMSFSALVKSLRTSCDAVRNLVVSCSSVTKDLTTRIAATFSCTELFRASYFLKMRRKIGKATRTMTARTIARTGTIPRKISAIEELIRHAMTTEKTIMSGTRTAMRISIPKAFWTLVTSVVMRVTREDVEKRSMSAKEKSWTAKKRSWRRFFARPTDAVAEKRAASRPQASEAKAKLTRMIPRRMTGTRETPSRASTRDTMISGIRHSRTTSPMMKSGVRTAGALNSRSRPSSVPMVFI